MTAKQIIDKYISFFEKKGHKRIPNSSLIPQNDPTTLFTSSGMQPLIQYFLGEKHPQGKRLVNVQNCFRALDIDEVGDNRHTTFFRMLGNWSLGDYFKKEEIPWLWEFLTKALGLPKEKLFISIFKGEGQVPYDQESYNIWTKLLKDEGENPEEKIFAADVTKNWWSRSGVPDDMPVGEPGGPDTEVYFRFDDVKHNPSCRDNPVECGCGKFLEIGNAVFMEYLKTKTGFENLSKQNVDFGGGLGRILAAVENQSDIFQTSLFSPIISGIENATKKDYKTNSTAMRIIADHLVAAVFITAAGVTPSNKEQGYILRRLIRRAVRYGRQLDSSEMFTADIASMVIDNYYDTDPQLKKQKNNIKEVFKEEEKKFVQVLQEGLKKAEEILSELTPVESSQYAKIMQVPNKKELFRNIYRNRSVSPFGIEINIDTISKATISGKNAFDLYQSFGFPIEMIIELAQEKSLLVDIEDFEEEVKKHQEISRTAGTQKFAGGLADHSEKTIMGHTATHLLHKALRDVLGNHVFQTGSNITNERVRFDFNFERKLTDDELQKVEDIVNEKIKENLPVHFEIIPLKKAKEIGAIGLFDEKYEDKVKVYFIGNYSKEVCGGPHVDFTGKLKRVKIIKQENIGHNQRRIYAKV